MKNKSRDKLPRYGVIDVLKSSYSYTYVGTQHLIVSLTQTPPSLWPAGVTHKTHYPLNKRRRGVSLHHGGEDEEHFLPGAALSILICCLIDNADPGTTCRP